MALSDKNKNKSDGMPKQETPLALAYHLYYFYKFYKVPSI